MPRKEMLYIVRGRSINGTVYYGGGKIWEGERALARRFHNREAAELAVTKMTEVSALVEPDYKVGRLTVLEVLDRGPDGNPRRLKRFFRKNGQEDHVEIAHNAGEWDAMTGAKRLRHYPPGRRRDAYLKARGQKELYGQHRGHPDYQIYS